LHGTLNKKSICLLVVLSQGGWAQTNRSAEPLVTEVSSFARSGNSWKAKGYITEETDGKHQSPEEFSIAYQVPSPSRARFEITSGSNPLLRICDGASQWTYYPKSNGYIRVMLPQISPCAYPINAWPPLPITLRSPVLLGTSQTPSEGGPQECQIVRGTFLASANDPRRRILTLCVDPRSKLVRRYQVEELAPKSRTQTVTFSSILRDEKLDPELFQFHAPKGSEEIAVINWLDPIAKPSSQAFRVSNEVTAPLLVSMGDAAKTRSGPAVVLYAEVNSEGIPQNIKVVGQSGTGLDDKAVEAVEKWRFEPGIKDGKPVTVVTVIAIGVPTP
jgi:TonB family protein